VTELCVDFGGSAVKVGIAARGRLLATESFPVTGGIADLELVERAARAMTGEPIRTVAIAVPGLVDADGSRMVAAHGKYGWMLYNDLRQWSADTFGAAAIVENDARAALIGETATGCAAGEADAVIMVLGTGIGTAAMQRGVPLRGPDGSAGILGGHLTIDWVGPECNCGNIGCAEVYGGSWALPDRIRDRFPDGLPEEWVGRLATEHFGFADLFALSPEDETASDVLEEAILAWGVTAVNLTHAYDPRTIVIAGGVARAADRFVPTLEAALDEHVWSTVPRPAIAVSTEPESSVLSGLAALSAKEGTA